MVTPAEMERSPGASWFDGTVARPTGIDSARTIRDEVSEGKFPSFTNTEFVTGTVTPDSDRMHITFGYLDPSVSEFRQVRHGGQIGDH